MMNYYINRRVIYVLDTCSMLFGMLFQLNWNTIPANLEQGYILAVTLQFTQKLVVIANR